jgi:hypothetical protein
MRSIIGRSSCPVMGTLTTAENVRDKKDASKRFRRVLERIRRHFKKRGQKVEICGAWQRQRRGAWHPHFVCSRRLDVNWLRAVAVESGFGVQMRLDYIKPTNGFRHVGAKYTVNYIGRYVTRDFSDTADAKGARLTFYFNTVRGKCRGWSFAGGLSKLHRLGCRRMFGPESEFDWEDVRRLKVKGKSGLPGLWVASEGRWATSYEHWRMLVLEGWASLHPMQRDSLFATSVGVQRFLAEEGLVDAPF